MLFPFSEQILEDVVLGPRAGGLPNISNHFCLLTSLICDFLQFSETHFLTLPDETHVELPIDPQCTLCFINCGMNTDVSSKQLVIVNLRFNVCCEMSIMFIRSCTEIITYILFQTSLCFILVKCSSFYLCRPQTITQIKQSKKLK